MFVTVSFVELPSEHIAAVGQALQAAETTHEVALVLADSARHFEVEQVEIVWEADAARLALAEFAADDSPHHMGRQRLVFPLLSTTSVIGSVTFDRRLPFSSIEATVLGMAILMATARLALLGAGDATATKLDLAGLTRRQLDVARLAANGRTNCEIALRLAISENTVKKHLKDVFVRLGVGNRTELAHLSLQLDVARRRRKRVGT
jgi:DNA-binding CsgD family transcriptional regulator